jgi:3-hydroxymyristoyl/3-hydroxydecanoyl-(acyl carrier protein) dehydratase
MDPHFRAFSFVDRITALQNGRRITGVYRVPASVERFPAALIPEAVGQLAAWAAMAAVGFSHRPVAGIAGRVELLGEVQPGQRLELAAQLDSVDEEAVAYDGQATVGDRPMVRLQHCVGPMMPLETFDDPVAVRARCQLLLDPGVPPGGFDGLQDLSFDAVTSTSAASLDATVQVPQQARLFADHFPRRPVFPGSLLTGLGLELAAHLLQSGAPPAQGLRWVPRVIEDLKLRSFISPGQKLRLRASRVGTAAHPATVAIEMHAETRRLGSCRVDLLAEAGP